jgi:quercetin dioxygenase-like cupin family protein
LKFVQDGIVPVFQPEPYPEHGRNGGDGSGRREEPDMEPHDIRAAVSSLPELKITSAITEAEAMAAMRVIGSFNQCMVGMVRFSGRTPWERHPDDELLYVMQGEVEVTVLADAGAVQTTVRAGSVFVVPKGLWHQQMPRPEVALLFLTSAAGNEVSMAEDPRTGS